MLIGYIIPLSVRLSRKYGLVIGLRIFFLEKAARRAATTTFNLLILYDVGRKVIIQDCTKVQIKKSPLLD